MVQSGEGLVFYTSPSMGDTVRYGLGTTFSLGGGLHWAWLCDVTAGPPSLGRRVGRGEGCPTVWGRGPPWPDHALPGTAPMGVRRPGGFDLAGEE